MLPPALEVGYAPVVIGQTVIVRGEHFAVRLKLGWGPSGSVWLVQHESALLLSTANPQRTFLCSLGSLDATLLCRF